MTGIQFVKRCANIRLSIILLSGFVFGYLMYFLDDYPFSFFLFLCGLVFLLGLYVSIFLGVIDIILEFKKNNKKIGNKLLLLVYLFLPSISYFAITTLLSLNGDNSTITFISFLVTGYVNFLGGIPLVKKIKLLENL